MIEQTKKSPLARLWQQIKGELRLQVDDFWQLILIPLGATLFFVIILTATLLWAGDVSDAPEMVGNVVCLVPVVVGVPLGILVAGSLFTVRYKLGLQMGQTRKNMLLRLTALSLVEQGYILACSLVFSYLITLFYSSFFLEIEYLFANVPWWGWVLMLTLPLGAGVFSGAILMRFGRKGFWVLYAAFMAAVLLPQFFPESAGTIGGDLLIEQVAVFVVEYPQVSCLASLLPFAIGAALLWHLPLKD